MKKIKFLFDLGNVFFDWDPRHFYKDVFSNINEMEYFLSEICNDKWNIQQDAGRTIEEAEKDLIPLFPNYQDKIKLYYKNHGKMIKGVFETSIELLEELKKQGYLCYVLSNWSAETFLGTKEKFSFLNFFDGLIISGEEKLIKPDPKIFHLACERFNLIPENTIFIDDRVENIDTASRLNFQTIHLTNPAEIKSLVKKQLMRI